MFARSRLPENFTSGGVCHWAGRAEEPDEPPSGREDAPPERRRAGARTRTPCWFQWCSSGNSRRTPETPTPHRPTAVALRLSPSLIGLALTNALGRSQWPEPPTFIDAPSSATSPSAIAGPPTSRGTIRPRPITTGDSAFSAAHAPLSTAAARYCAAVLKST